MNEFTYNADDFWRDKPSRRYKGGGGGNDPPNPYVSQTAASNWAREVTYPLVTNAIEGRGFGNDEFQSQRKRSFSNALGESYNSARQDLESNLARTIDPRDTRVKGYANNLMDRAQITSQDDMRRSLRAEKVADQTTGMDMGQQMMSNEQRIGVGNAQAYNNALSINMSNAQQMGTFGTNVASGLGQGMTDYLFAQKMGA